MRAKLHPFQGEMLSVSQIAERVGLSADTVRDRMRRGIPAHLPLYITMCKNRVLAPTRLVKVGDRLIVKRERDQ